jgi:hypothetical protein
MIAGDVEPVLDPVVNAAYLSLVGKERSAVDDTLIFEEDEDRVA